MNNTKKYLHFVVRRNEKQIFKSVKLLVKYKNILR